MPHQNSVDALQVMAFDNRSCLCEQQMKEKGDKDHVHITFPHNQKAYEALRNVLEMEHRGCVIHPIGSGKSFIGFTYCEDHSQQAALWLSPLE